MCYFTVAASVYRDGEGLCRGAVFEKCGVACGRRDASESCVTGRVQLMVMAAEKA